MARIWVVVELGSPEPLSRHPKIVLLVDLEAGAGVWTRPVFGPFVTIKVWMLRKSHRTKLLRYTWNLNWGPNTGLPKVGYRLLFRKPLRFAFCLAGWKSKLEPFPNKRTYLLDQFVLVLKLWPIEILGSKHRPPPLVSCRLGCSTVARALLTQ